MTVVKGNIRVLLTREDEGLVKRTVRQVLAKHRGLDDRQLEQELHHYGLVGLVEAKRAFEAGQGIPFPAFAVHRIKGAMIDYLRSAPVVRLPQKKQELRKQLAEAEQAVHQSGEEPDDLMVADRLGWPVTQVHRVRRLKLQMVSLTAAGNDSQDNAAGEDDLPSGRPGPEELLMKKELTVVVQGCLERMRSTRDRLILVARIVQGQTLRQLADSFACSLETVRLRQQQAVVAMKRCLEKQGWDGESLGKLGG